MQPQIDGLNDNFKAALPIIGGMLDEAGLANGAAISSAYRTPEHNAAVGGAKNSYHTHRDAVDIVLPEGTTQEQANKIMAKFKNTGAFKGVLFHDAGSGYHLHLGGYNGSLGNGATIHNHNDNEEDSNNHEDLNVDIDKIDNTEAKTENYFDKPTVSDGENLSLANLGNEEKENNGDKKQDEKVISNPANFISEDEKQNIKGNAPQRPNIHFEKGAKDEINIIKKYAAWKANKTQDGNEAHALRSLFKNYANMQDIENNNFIDDNKAIDYVVNNYGASEDFKKFMAFHKNELGHNEEKVTPNPIFNEGNKNVEKNENVSENTPSILPQDEQKINLGTNTQL